MFTSVAAWRREVRRVSTMLDYLGQGPILGIMLLTIIGSWLWIGIATIDGMITAPQALAVLSTLAGLALLAATGVHSRLGHSVIVTAMLRPIVTWMLYRTHDAAADLSQRPEQVHRGHRPALL